MAGRGLGEGGAGERESPNSTQCAGGQFLGHIPFIPPCDARTQHLAASRSPSTSCLHVEVCWDHTLNNEPRANQLGSLKPAHTRSPPPPAPCRLLSAQQMEGTIHTTAQGKVLGATRILPSPHAYIPRANKPRQNFLPVTASRPPLSLAAIVP